MAESGWNARQVAVGVDIGGTFTDVVCRAPDGAIRLVKIPTTRSNPGEGVRKAVDFMLSNWGVQPGDIARFVHGTTAAIMAVTTISKPRSYLEI